MVHSLTVTAVKLKMNFDPPAKIVNCQELCCAIGIAYKQAGVPLPEFDNGDNISSILSNIEPILKRFENVIDPKLFTMITNCSATSGTYNDDCRIILELGYRNDCYN